MTDSDQQHLPLESFAQDFSFLHELLQTVPQNLRQSERVANAAPPDSKFWSTAKADRLPDGRDYRFTFPNGVQFLRNFLTNTGIASDELQQGRLWFVGFFGTIFPIEEIPPRVLDEIWQVDDLLVEELPNHPHMLYYSSAKIAPDSDDWFNLVLFGSEEALEHWRTARFHEKALR